MMAFSFSWGVAFHISIKMDQVSDGQISWLNSFTNIDWMAMRIRFLMVML